MRTVFLTFCIAALFVTGVVFLILDQKPLARPDVDLTYDHIKQVQNIIRNNRPTWFSRYKKRHLILSEKDVNLLFSYTLSRGLNLSWLSGEIEFTSGSANGFITVRLPENDIGNYVNLTLAFDERPRLPELTGCSIGKIKIPHIILSKTLPLIHQLLLNRPDYKDFWNHTQTIEQALFKEKTLIVQYQLTPKSLEQIKQTGRELLLSDTEQERLLFYHNRLAQLTLHCRYGNNSVIDLLKEIIRAAANQSQISNAPVLENRAALQALGLYAAGQPLAHILNKNHTNRIKTARFCRMLFHDRSDLAKHFLVSSAISASTGSRSANFIGIFKEVEDASFAGGSGFSFADIAADKAGVRFGDLATRSKTVAERFQKKVRTIDSTADIMPSIHDLPEGMMEIAFKSKYKDFDSNAYVKTEAEIERRLDRCYFYKK